jgi:predicted O-methyltransferase YrrM
MNLRLVESWFFSTKNILEKKVIIANNIDEIKKYFGWVKNPIYERADVHKFEYLEDINERRIRHAEVICTVVANEPAKTILEIGTSTGKTTAFISRNAPLSEIYTINIPASDIFDGKGGKNTTIALEEAEIGKDYKSLNLKNITQIYENTATWQPDIGEINIAFIDGSHDTNFVYNDTLKVLKNILSGGIIMWHDFNPELKKKFHWINDVCKGVESLYKKGYLKGRIIVLKDSWVGLYKVP